MFEIETEYRNYLIEELGVDAELATEEAMHAFLFKDCEDEGNEDAYCGYDYEGYAIG